MSAHSDPTAHLPPRPAASLRGELSALARLAAPVVVVQVGLMAMGTVDTMMLGNLSPAALSAGALGHVYSMTLLVAAQGLLMALDPLVSQAFGAGQLRQVGKHLGRGVVLAVALTLPLTLAMLEAAPVLRWLGQPAELLPGASSYVRSVALGNAAYLLFAALRQSLQAMSIVRPAVYAIVAANLVNVATNRLLIFGGPWDLPALGVTGAAYATALSRWTLLLVLAVAAWRPLRAVWIGWGRYAVELRAHLEMLRIGVPIACQMALEMCVFVAVALLAGGLGVHQLAAHQIAINLASLTFMVPLGIGAAAATRVGNAIGAGDPLAARRAAQSALLLGIAVMVLFSLTFALLRQPLAGLFTPDPLLAQLAASLIAIAAVFQLFDGIQVVSLGVLRGAADTRVPALINLVGYWLIGLPFGMWLGLGLGLGPQGLWWGLTAGLGTVALLLLARMRWRFAATTLPALQHDEDVPQTGSV